MAKFLIGQTSYLQQAGGAVSDKVSELSRRTRQRIVDRGVALEKALDQVLDEAIETQSIQEGPDQEAKLRKELSRQLSAYGPLQPLLDDPSIEEIWLNSSTEIFVASEGLSRRINLSLEQDQIQTLVEKMLRNTGRRLDRSSPFVDASLEDGSRLHVVIPDITRTSWSINIRKFPSRIYSLQTLVDFGSISASQANYLSQQIKLGKNILISGATQAGKTTMLCALLNEISSNERIITVEETFEIRINAADWVAMQTRQPNLEGTGEVTLRKLVKEALRMRPGRIVVGEVREAESFDLLIALNSGLPGVCTIHANSARDAISKLCTLPLLAGSNISSEFVKPTVGSCIDVVVHCKLLPNGRRTVEEIATVSWNNQLAAIELQEMKL